MLHAATPRSIHEAALMRLVLVARRGGSRAMILAFLMRVAPWAFAPCDLARIDSLAAVGACITLMLGFAVWERAASGTSGRGELKQDVRMIVSCGCCQPLPIGRPGLCNSPPGR